MSSNEQITPLNVTVPGVPTAAFLEVISRELALQRLSEEQRASIKAEAERIAAERQNEAQEA